MGKLPGAAPALTEDEGHHKEISGLNRKLLISLSTLRNGGSLPHARLASGCWPGSPGRDCYPQGSYERFHGCNDSPFPSFFAQCQFCFQRKQN